MVNLMFIRFVSGEIDGDSLVSAGLFTAAFDLLYDPVLPDDDYFPLRELMDWFNAHVEDSVRVSIESASARTTRDLLVQTNCTRTLIARVGYDSDS